MDSWHGKAHTAALWSQSIDRGVKWSQDLMAWFVKPNCWVVQCKCLDNKYLGFGFSLKSPMRNQRPSIAKRNTQLSVAGPTIGLKIVFSIKGIRAGTSKFHLGDPWCCLSLGKIQERILLACCFDVLCKTMKACTVACPFVVFIGL